MEDSKEEIQAENRVHTSADALAKRIEKASEGLSYISETDADISVFVGQQAEFVNKETLLLQIKKASDISVKEKDFADFFLRLTQIQEWFGEEETQTANGFAYLREVLERNLRDLKVFKIGEIQLDVYVVGLEAGNLLMGVKTEAVETGD